MHVSKFQLGIPNGCCITKAQVKHVLVTRRHAFTERVSKGNPAKTKFAAENTSLLAIGNASYPWWGGIAID